MAMLIEQEAQRQMSHPSYGQLAVPSQYTIGDEALQRLLVSLARVSEVLLNMGNFLDANKFWQQLTTSDQLLVIQELFNAAKLASPIRLKEDTTTGETRPTYPYMKEIFLTTSLNAEQHWGTVKAILWGLAASRAVDHKILIDNTYTDIIPAIVDITPDITDVIPGIIIEPVIEVIEDIIAPVDIVTPEIPTAITTAPAMVKEILPLFALIYFLG